MPRGDLFRPQGGVVFDDPIVHDGATLARNMRVGILGGRLTMGGPAGVGDADAAFERFRGDGVYQLGHLAERAQAPHAAAGAQHGETRGVITAILQPLQPLQQDGRHGPLSDGADDAAHNIELRLWA